MSRLEPLTLLAILALPVTLAILLCIQFVDGRVATEIWSFTSSHPIVQNRISDIPSPLHKMVAIATTIFWVTYVIVLRTNVQNKHVKFVKLAAITIPSAFLLKTFLQYAFGRTRIRLWLQTGGPIEFKWFNPLESGGFPSGHMIIVTAFLTAVWLYYPRFRTSAVVILTILSVALLLTSYHFVSDIIAGVYFGILITVSIDKFFSINHSDSN